MMKISSKPISSPGRTEKFPPPLMRFLRSNTGSRSRGRSRSSPMFFRRKIAAVETQEPSSPKVTCMGQVRVRRSKKPSGTGAQTSRRCKWVRDALFCPSCPSCSLFTPDWRRWGTFFQSGCRRKVETREDCRKVEPESEDERVETRQEGDENEAKGAEVLVSSCNSPPKNALLLTRSRSAPYRSSSLAGRFWGSPTTVSEETGEEKSSRTEQQNGEERFSVADSYKPTSENEPTCRDSDQESRWRPENDEKLILFKEDDEEEVEGCSNRDTTVKSESCDSVRPPLLLARCKSAPARTAAAANLGTDMNFWKLTRFADSDSCS